MFSEEDFVQSGDVRRRLFSGGGSGSSYSFLVSRLRRKKKQSKEGQRNLSAAYVHTELVADRWFVQKKSPNAENHVWVPLDSILDYIDSSVNENKNNKMCC